MAKNHWVVQCENESSGIIGQRMPRSAQSDQSFRCPQTESLGTTDISVESKCPDETLRMCSIASAPIFCALSKTLYRLTWPLLSVSSPLNSPLSGDQCSQVPRCHGRIQSTVEPRPALTQNFHGKFWINLGYRIYFK